MGIIQGTTDLNHHPDVKMLPDGTLVTSGTRFEVEEAQAVLGNSYSFSGECHTAANDGGTLLYVKNLMKTSNIHITRCFFDAQTITPTTLYLTQGTDVTSTIMGGVAAMPKQKNSGSEFSLGTADCTFLISNGSSDIALTGGSAFHVFPIDSRERVTRHMAGTNIIAPGGEWYIGYKTTTGDATDGEIISMTINCYVKDPD